MKADIDRTLCTGCGLCAQLCPRVFSLDNEGIAVAIEGDVPAELEFSCRDAAGSCPVSAISLD
jgi:ferredoxin